VSALDPAEQWFRSHGWSAFDFQREVWMSYLDGESGLIHAATGTGKTLAAWWGPILEYLHEERTEEKSVPLRVLWITPLRALAADTAEALIVPVNDLDLPWIVETRTGDTTAASRSRQSRRLPTALVTTPESLSLLLSRGNASAQFADLRLVVVDEWHELMGTKRGVQTQLALARLRGICPRVRTWGLSATIGNIEEAKATLLGRRPSRSRIVRGVEPKAVIVDSLIPPVIERFPWAGHLGTQMVPQVVAAIEEGETAIVFTNTRSQTEIWYQAILGQRPDWAGSIALHHGSLDRKRREWVEEGLRTARLRCVVATSSLDLGVDF
jgi:ATP-dependent helicase Lhr and Lhr-like helicase